jgi:hypothetical protein
MIRHFPSSTKTWFNSIYTYDKNVTKSIPFSDKIVNNIIKMYFNLQSNVNMDSNFVRRRTIRRRLSTRKIFVSKAEMKHSNDKIIINLYTYNKNKKYYTNKLTKLYRNIFSYLPLSTNTLKSIIFEIKKFNLSITNNDKKNLINFFNSMNNVDKKFFNVKKKYRLNKKYKKFVKLHLYKYFSNFYKNYLENNYNSSFYVNFKYISTRSSMIFNKFINRSKNIIKILEDNKLYGVINVVNNNKSSNILKLSNLKSFNNYNNAYYNSYIKESLTKEMLYLRYNQLLNTDAYKFNNIYLSRLSSLIGNIYNKKIEFNIINLKYMFLDSHIFSESITLKIRNRKNKLIKVLKKALTLQKINNAKKYKYNIQNPYIRNYNLCDKNINYTGNSDILNIILNKIFNMNILSSDEKLKDSNNKYIYRSIRFRKIRGVRLEAKGRLTRRLTASRSTYKLRHKGSLKNIDSSINSLSSVILRGYAKSNIDYVNLNSKTRNGSFGLKGWISSK